MSIKHMPSGLFPHFDSALERRPFFVRAGDRVKFGCRLDGSEAASVGLEITDDTGTVTVPGVYCSRNDRGQRYFSFSYDVKEDGRTFTYRFVTSDHEASKRFTCPVLRELTLYPEIAARENGTNLIFRTDTQAYQIEISGAPCIRIILKHDLNVKINNNFDKLEYIYTKYTVQGPDGNPIARLDPALKVMVDEKGGVHNIRLGLEFPGSAVYGLGEKFDAVNQAGKKPLNYVVEQFSNQQEKTYLPIPFLFTDSGVSFLQKTTYPSSFDFSRQSGDGWVGLDLFAVCPRSGVLFEAAVHTGTPAELLRAYAADTGKVVLPPKWAFGPWMSSNGWNTQAVALAQIRRMNETAIPATVMVLEAWSDEETFYIWNDARYTPRKDGGRIHYRDFTFPEDGKWPNPKAFCDTLKDNGVKLILWQIPVIKYEAAPHGEQLDLDWEYARENGLCLKNADGTPYQITEMWFGNSLIPDFTNPETRQWWLNCRRYLVDELGVAGFKTDGGEFLFDPDAVFADGRRVAEAHNDFPNLYEGTYHELLQDSGGITFSRAGYTGAQRYPIHWAGDQLSGFSELKGQLTAGLSLGLSGVPFWGFDIGGFAGDFPTTELYLRSAAFGAFAPVMQFHSEPRGGQYYMVQRNHWNNDRSPWNMAIANQDESIVPVYRLFANLRMNLLPYIWQEAQHSTETVRPLMAHLIYDYPEDRAVRNLEDEYLFGRDLLVAPVITEGAAGRAVYLPEGVWFDLWTGEKHSGKQTIDFPCPIDRIPVFVRDGAAIPVNMNGRLCMGTRRADGAVSNDLSRYENLCFLLFGTEGNRRFRDELGNDVTLIWKQNRETVDGKLACPITLFRMDGSDHGDEKGTIFDRTLRGMRKEKL